MSLSAHGAILCRTGRS